MSELSIYISARPGSLGEASRIADGLEIKLDWEHAADLQTGKTLSEYCRQEGVSTEAVGSVHLPPGIDRRYGMTVGPGNTGTITEFTHTAFGEEIVPEWLTVHSPRQFVYQEHIERLGTITELTGYPVAVENTPDTSYFHAPEELAVFALLTARITQLADTYLLIDTAHVDSKRRALGIDESVIRRILKRTDRPLEKRLKDRLHDFISGNLAERTVSLPPDDPWCPVLTTLYAVGGPRVRAIHLNDPVEDGLPAVGHDEADGLGQVLQYCREHEIAIVLEPGESEISSITEVVKRLRANV